jgi:hypothetical protein
MPLVSCDQFPKKKRQIWCQNRGWWVVVDIQHIPLLIPQVFWSHQIPGQLFEAEGGRGKMSNMIISN